MPSEQGAAAARQVDLDFSGARLHGPDFEGVKITDGSFRGADVSADIEGLILNGVEVEPLVRAELERRFPERAKLRARDPAGLADAWSMIEATWASTVERALSMPERLLHERVEEEWSLVETLRHLVLATDCWLARMVHGEPRPYHPWGLAGSWLRDPATWGLDPDADPSFAQILEVRRGRMDAVAQTIAILTPAELERLCVPPASPGHPNAPHAVLQCLHVILDEEWEHHGYATRDLEVLSAR